MMRPFLEFRSCLALVYKVNKCVRDLWCLSRVPKSAPNPRGFAVTRAPGRLVALLQCVMRLVRHAPRWCDMPASGAKPNPSPTPNASDRPGTPLPGPPVPY